MPDRDNQKRRVYDAEGPIQSQGLVSKAAHKYLGKQTLRVHEYRSKEVYCCDDAQLMKYVNSVLDSAWFQRRWGFKRLGLRHDARTVSHGGFGMISVSRAHRRQESLVLHEIAHNLTPPGAAWHGPEFASILLTLVRYQMGKPAADTLRAGYKRYRVRTKASAVPPPSTEKLAAARSRR